MYYTSHCEYRLADELKFYLFDITGSITGAVASNLTPANADTVADKCITIGSNIEAGDSPQQELSNWTGSYDDVRY